MYSKELLKGTLQTIILKLLTEQERMYGYSFLNFRNLWAWCSIYYFQKRL